MRSLRERLQSIEPSPAQANRAAAAPNHFEIESVLEGFERSNELGAYFVAEHVLDATTFTPLTSQPPFSPRLFAARWPDSLHVTAGDLLFIDTETTGLAGGTGTHAFLIGVGYFDGGVFRLRQYFMRGFHEEPAILRDIIDLLREFAAIVTFNGSSFDWPLLETRLLFHGHREFPRPVHWDLLHPARRLWRHRLGDCSLGNLEARLFGVARIDDVPGFLIPGLYFDYVRSHDARPLRPVFSHNQEDIVTLARLANLYLRVDHTPDTALTDPSELLGLALLRIERERRASGLELLAKVVDHPGLSADLAARAISALALELRRDGDRAGAAGIWRRLCDVPGHTGIDVIRARVELAKFYEHHARDYPEAIRQVELALNRADLDGLAHLRPDLTHRMSRLLRRRGKRAAAS
jgi:uncharacterized protein